MNRKHSAAHKAAVVHAVLELGMTYKQAAALARAGELKVAGSRKRMGAFEIADSTVKGYVHRHRRKGLRAQTADEPADDKPADDAPPQHDDGPEPGSFLDSLPDEQEEDRGGRNYTPEVALEKTIAARVSLPPEPPAERDEFAERIVAQTQAIADKAKADAEALGFMARLRAVVLELADSRLVLGAGGAESNPNEQRHNPHDRRRPSRMSLEPWAHCDPPPIGSVHYHAIPERTCRTCGQPFMPVRKDQTYCRLW